MINKQTAQRHGVNVIDNTDAISAQKSATLAKLKALIPNIVNSDGQVNSQALQDVIDITHTTSNNKGYELTFAGKGIARAKADSETPFELQFEPEQSKNMNIVRANSVRANTVRPNSSIPTENVVIRGDNLEVLKILKQNYFEKIKMIYIDPPYNTKSENFIYNDNFKQNESDLIKDFGLKEDTTNFLHNVYGTRSHSGWLSFMYPRLKLARDLLKDDGVIFISIDDNEQANLKILCDEIFGEDNFVYNLSVVNNLNGNDNSSGMMETQETCLIYAKDKNNFQMGVLSLNEEESSKWEKDNMGFWKEGGSLKATGIGAPREARPKLYFPIYIDENNLTFSLEESDNYSYKLLPITDEKEMRWYWSKEKFNKDKNEVIIKKTTNGYSLYKKQRPSLGDLPSKRGKTTFYKPSYSNSHGNKTIKDLFKLKTFDYSKSIHLIKDFVQLANTNKTDIILDFFAGSGTTGDAVMQLNAEDGGTRKFILVQWDEAIKENTESHKFCVENKFEPVISSITIERLNRAGAKIQKENEGKLDFDGKNLDIGYQVFSLTEKPQLTEDENGLFKIENERTETINTLYNMLCATGKPLHTPIKALKQNVLYEADNELYVVGNIAADALAKYHDRKINVDGYADISLENWLNLDIINKDHIIVVY